MDSLPWLSNFLIITAPRLSFFSSSFIFFPIMIIARAKKRADWSPSYSWSLFSLPLMVTPSRDQPGFSWSALRHKQKQHPLLQPFQKHPRCRFPLDGGGDESAHEQKEELFSRQPEMAAAAAADSSSLLLVASMYCIECSRRTMKQCRASNRRKRRTSSICLPSASAAAETNEAFATLHFGEKKNYGWK